MGGGIQTNIDTSQDTTQSHVLHHVEENMPENHSRCWLDIFGRRSKPHEPSETRMSAKTYGASGDVPTVKRRKIK